MDENFVYLELAEVEFEASNHGVMVSIPIDVWETIRHLTIARFDLADKGDDELQAMVETEVDERIRLSEVTAKKGRGFFRVGGTGVFGSPDEPRDEQIKSGMESYQRQRRRQQEILERMKQHQVSRHWSENIDLK